MTRVPIIGLRKPLKLEDLRSPIELSVVQWYPVYTFEGYYEIDSYGNIRHISTQEFLKIYETSKFNVVVLKSPNTLYGSAVFNHIDVYCASVLGKVEYMEQYDYRKKRMQQNE